jgi:hypothetical protein
MKVSVRTRALTLAVTAGVMLTAPLALPASAAAKPSLSCAKLASTTTLNLTAKTGTVSSSFLTCTPAGLAAGGSGKVTVPIAKITGSLTTKITWNGGQGTTTVNEKFTAQKTTGACPKGTKYLTLVTGTTQASTGAAAKIIKAGEPISGSICTVVASSTKYVSSLLKGTQFKL